ncbi:MAG: hypothetical protein AMXMBFR44_5300 [Candidatus Campbellbacteria bacterium]
MSTAEKRDGAPRRLLQKRKLSELEHTNEEVAKIFTDIAHALQTPLSCLMSELTALERHTTNSAADHIRHCGRIIQNMSALIQNALYISRLEQSEFETFMQDISLSELLEDVMEYVTTLTAQRRISLSSNIQTGVWVRGIPDKLEELIIAVLSNSIKYCKPRGKRTIAVTLHANNTSAVIHIQDNGIGIATEDMPHIFNRFYRTPNASQQSERGTGLGLAIAKKIADKHSVTIDIESTLNVGTSVRITFPVKKG